MTQGRATTSIVGGTKVEPKSNIVSVEAVAEIGIHEIHIGSGPQLYEGRRLQAPMVGTTQYEHGSQGKHK